ncbi:hypothetical protein PG991_004311 [Apiospora marii]|uniref:Uncharacterized protein n=1 Tax=Apiospora marii TaxID=335849 RepID=A0ABR1S7A3_9PEZI
MGRGRGRVDGLRKPTARLPGQARGTSPRSDPASTTWPVRESTTLSVADSQWARIDLHRGPRRADCRSDQGLLGAADDGLELIRTSALRLVGIKPDAAVIALWLYSICAVHAGKTLRSDVAGDKVVLASKLQRVKGHFQRDRAALRICTQHEQHPYGLDVAVAARVAQRRSACDWRVLGIGVGRQFVLIQCVDVDAVLDESPD